jgi:hypothetical protein
MAELPTLGFTENAGDPLFTRPMPMPLLNAGYAQLAKSVSITCSSSTRAICGASYVTYYNEARPHQGIQQDTPIPRPPCTNEGAIRRREVLGGLIHDFYREAA